MSANEKQIGGDHYKEAGRTGEEHWDRVWRLKLNYWQAAATKYIERYRYKNGKEDLLKAIHYIEKLIELEYPDKPALKEESPPKIINHFNPGQVAATGWVQFVFEGANVEGYLYTCRECNEKFYAPPGCNPHTFHGCNAIAASVMEVVNLTSANNGEEPTKSYINQG